MQDNSFNKIRINCAALQHNYDVIQKMVGSRIPVMAMVKADGYGHGMVGVSRVFARAGCRDFGVAELREAVCLREAEIEGDIYVTIGFAGEDAGFFFQHRLTPVIYSYEAAQALSIKATELATDIAVHIKIDSGMSRLGIFPAELPAFLDAVSRLPGLTVGGIMSHFAESDDPGSNSTDKSFALFADSCREMKNRFAGTCHIANSGAVLNFPDTYCDMVRSGIALYGYHPAGKAGPNDRKIDLLPAMSFCSRILQIKTLPAGTGVSYGHTFRTSRQTRVAVLPVGYEDGYSRALSNSGQVLIQGRPAGIVGRICMNMSMVDVTDIENVQAGDEVVLLGGQERQVISADDIAAQMGSISYEVLCLLGNNNQREYIE